MDTDDLSREAYEGILIAAERLTHDLTLHYGLLSSDCDDENEYIDKAEKLTRKMLQVDEDRLEDLFWGNSPGKDKLDFTLKKILDNIEKVKKIPMENRHFD